MLAQPVLLEIERHRESTKAKLASVDAAERLWPFTLVVHKTTSLTDQQWCAYSKAVFHSPLTPDRAAVRLGEILGIEVVRDALYRDPVWGLSGNNRFFEVRSALYRGSVNGGPKWALSTLEESVSHEEALKCRVVHPSEEFQLWKLCGPDDRCKDPAWEWAPNDPDTDPISAFARRDNTYGKSPWTLSK
jgi:hypothetical protein